MNRSISTCSRTQSLMEETTVAKIVILNGSPRKNGKTASLVKAFINGAESVGNEVKELYLQGMNIGGCLACEGCQRNRSRYVHQRIGY